MGKLSFVLVGCIGIGVSACSGSPDQTDNPEPVSSVSQRLCTDGYADKERYAYGSYVDESLSTTNGYDREGCDNYWVWQVDNTYGQSFTIWPGIAEEHHPDTQLECEHSYIAANLYGKSGTTWYTVQTVLIGGTWYGVELGCYMNRTVSGSWQSNWSNWGYSNARMAIRTYYWNIPSMWYYKARATIVD